LQTSDCGYQFDECHHLAAQSFVADLVTEMVQSDIEALKNNRRNGESETLSAGGSNG